ncbi:MAG TPA: sigma-70 family RNA polymerase sigma factor [Peptococcaceae bacterium]|jgi:RNA polymerase sigma-70 factor (ECF subfamily)|nr:sigma-70 family RNA polymerase sigma factor [Peptococcaceae bacterium]
MTGVRILPEKNLIAAAQSGDSDAFTQLVQRYSSDAYRTAYMVLHDREDVEDVVQEAFLTCYRKINTFRMDSSFKTWLYRIVVNLCYDRIRKRSRERAAFQRVSINMKTGYRDMSDIEKRIDLKEVIATLNPDYRITLTLYYGMDFSVQKVAEVLGIPVGTVKSRLNSARNLLKERLERGHKYAL